MTQGEAQSADHPLVGTTVGKYKIVQLLGEGGMGAVYLAEQQLGTATRKVALKTLHKHLSHDASIKARFDREAGTVAALEHPNTIQVYDFGAMDDGTLYLVMEFVQGKSVADILLQDGPMPPARVENIMKQVCGSLAEAHSHGIVHRDLKPDNVVLCDRAGQKDWVEVLDFGIAKRSTEHDPNEAKLTQQGMVLGTPPYMSPEQFTGMPVDSRSDIYALGVMAYEMLTGQLPWKANTAWEWASKHMTEPPTPVERQPLGPHVPAHMRNAIARALAKAKEERFGTVTEFYEALSGGAAVPSVAAAQAEAPAGSRVKTELGQPAIPAMDAGFGAMGGPAQVPAPGPGHFGASPSMPGGAAPSIPQGPAHAGPQKKGVPGLVLGLAALAVLLLVGAGIALVAGGKKNVAETTPLASALAEPSSNVTASAVPTADEVVTAAPALASAAPLEPATTKATTAVGAVGAVGAGGGTQPKKTAPIPTPKPPSEPPDCVAYRNAKAAGSTRVVVKSLENACRKAGGTP